ncbi:MAG: hypothetical protein IPO90_17235 [Flavobacteriales bacterium]|nr:hypothetical protein [Flavobacteriales bacterium]
MKNNYNTVLATAALLLVSQLSAQSAHQGKTHAPKALNAVTSTVQNHPVAGAARGTAPANDQCSSVTFTPLAIDGSLTFTGDLTGATIDNDYEAGSAIEGAALAATPPLVSVWHGFSTTDCANVTVTFCGITPAFGDAWIILGTACPVGDASAVFNTSWNTADCGDGNITIFYTTVQLVTTTSRSCRT